MSAALLLDAARRGEIHHSVILSGPVPAQLRQLALSIAKSLTCLSRTTGDDCASCLKIDRGIHPDVYWISVAEERKLISVEQVRNLVAAAVLRPFQARFKVFIIEPAEALSISGENALLKTLEEPVRDTVFLLLTRSADALLPTIRSRSQTIYVAPLDSAKDEATSLQAARLRPLALWSAEKSDVTQDIAREVLAALRETAEGNEAALLRIAAELSSGEDSVSALALLAALFRDLAALPPEQSLDPEAFRIVQQAFSRNQLLSCAALALRAITRLEVNADVRLLIEQSLLPLAQQKTLA